MKMLPIVLTFLMSLLTAPGFAQQPAGDSPLEADALSTPIAEFDPRGYYLFRQDLRLCPSPLCGGYIVKDVNHKLTRCANGTYKNSCYVAAIDNPQNIDLTSATLVQGRIKPKTYPGFGNLGIFVLQMAFTQATDAMGQGSFVGLENNGIICVTAPCFSIDQSLLNSCKSRAISGIDLTSFGASGEDIKKAEGILASGGVLIAAGVDKQVKETAGLGVTFVANQVYFPIGAGGK